MTLAGKFKNHSTETIPGSLGSVDEGKCPIPFKKKLCGVQRGEAKNKSFIGGALFPFLSLSVACPLFPLKTEYCSLSVCRKDLKGKKTGEFKKWKGKGIQNGCFMSKIHGNKEGKDLFGYIVPPSFRAD